MNLSGPQSDRDALWRTSSLNRQDIEYPSAEKKIYENELNSLRGENKSLRDQLQRAFIELKAYQVRYPSPYSLSEVEGDQQFVVSPEHVITPLLEAYDTRINELEDIVKQQNFKIEDFVGKVML